MKELGHHYLIELYDCKGNTFQNPAQVQAALVHCAEQAGITVLNQMFHAFTPHGVSGVLVISESHIAVHTWPEHGYIAVDLFSCNLGVEAETFIKACQTAFGAERHEVKLLLRGNLA